MPDPEGTEREAIATLIQECFPTGAGGYSVIWEDCLPAADAILTARRLSEAGIRRDQAKRDAALAEADVFFGVGPLSGEEDYYNGGRREAAKAIRAQFSIEETTNGPEKPVIHSVKQEVPWPPSSEATYMLSKWVCSCGWEGAAFRDVKGNPDMALADRNARFHEEHSNA